MNLPGAILGFTLVVLALAARGQDDDFRWASGVDGNWNDPARWVPGDRFPGGATDHVTIDAPGAGGNDYTVLANGQTILLGRFTLDSADATVFLPAAAFRVSGPSTLTQGSLAMTGGDYRADGLFEQRGGDVRFEDSTLAGLGSYVKAGGTILLKDSEITLPFTQTSGDFIAQGESEMTEGLNNSGSLSLVAGSSLTLRGGATVNEGTILTGGTFAVTSATAFDNSGLLEVSGGNATMGSGTGATSWQNSGTIRVLGGSFRTWAFPITNTGEILIEGGEAVFQFPWVDQRAHLFRNSGTITVAPQATFKFVGSNNLNAPPLQFESGPIGGGGTLWFENVPGVELADGLNAQDVHLKLVRARSVTGTGTLRVGPGRFLETEVTSFKIPVSNAGTMVVGESSSGEITNEPGGRLVFLRTASFSGTIVNHGFFHPQPSALYFHGSVLNSSTGTLFVEGVTTPILSIDFENHGLIDFQHIYLGSDFYGGGDLLNHGTMSCREKLQFGRDDTEFINAPGGRLEGTGWYNSSESIDIENEGTIAPGAPVGTLKVSRLNSAPTSILEIEIAGHAHHDVLELAGGRHILGGTLRPRFVSGYLPTAFRRFTVVRGESLFGQFASVEQPYSYGTFSVNRTASEVTLTFTPTESASFSTYQELFFSPAQIANGDADLDADFDRDGLTTFQEWLHGFSPALPVHPVPQVRLERHGETIHIIYSEYIHLPNRPVVTVQTATDAAGPWESLPILDVREVSRRASVDHPQIMLNTLHLVDTAWLADPARLFRLHFSGVTP